MGNQVPSKPHIYEIRLRGHLDESWREFFSGLAFTHSIAPDGTPVTVLRGPIVDEAGLHGLLARIRDVNIPLLLVRRTTDENDGAPADTPETKRPS